MFSEIETCKVYPYGAASLRDPQAEPDQTTMAVRTLAQTNTVLQRLIGSEKLTFWGEAIRLVLDYLAHHPEFVDLEHLETAPRALTCMGGAIKYPGAPVSRGVLCAMTPAAVEFVTRYADENKTTPSKAAALILHRNAARTVAVIQELRRGMAQ